MSEQTIALVTGANKGIGYEIAAGARTLSARRAQRILTVSDAARQQLVRWMHIPADRQYVVHLGVDMQRFSPEARRTAHPLGDAAYVLWVGRPYPGKNVGTLLDAFAELRLCGEVLRQMNRIAIAGELREADHIGRSNGLRQGLGHADREIFEVENTQRQDHEART